MALIGRTSNGIPIFGSSPQQNTGGRNPVALNYGQSKKPAEQQANTASVSTSTGGGGNRVGDNLDQRSAKILDSFIEILDREVSDETLRREKEDAARRLRSSESQMLTAIYLGMAGNTQGSAALLQAAADEAKSLKYIISKIEADPEGYKQEKIVRLTAEMGQSLQGSASVATAMYIPESLEAQRQATNAQLALASRSGGYTTNPQSAGIDDKTTLGLLQMLYENTSNRKGREKLNGFIAQLLGFNNGSIK